MSEWAVSLPQPLAGYVHSISHAEHPVLARLREETSSFPNCSMQITPEVGQFLQVLVRGLGAKRCLEIGVFTGYSSTSVALALPDDGRLIACDVNDQWTAVARRYWREAGVEHKIELRLAPALQTLGALLRNKQQGTFDFAFIDADKGNYANYYDQALELLRPGGLIAIDNVLWSGRVADPSVNDPQTLAIRAFNAKLRDDPRVLLAVLPIRDGITLASKI